MSEKFSLVLECQRVLRELLGFHLHWNHEAMGSNKNEKCLSNRLAELVSKSEGKQAKSKSFLLPCEV